MELETSKEIDYRDSSELPVALDLSGYRFPFVGSAPDGPQGVIGLNTLTKKGFGMKMVGTARNLDLEGGFGADPP